MGIWPLPAWKTGKQTANQNFKNTFKDISIRDLNREDIFMAAKEDVAENMIKILITQDSG